jgi:hypothetical protein
MTDPQVALVVVRGDGLQIDQLCKAFMESVQKMKTPPMLPHPMDEASEPE